MEPDRAKWVPKSDEDREAVIEALEKILASPQFYNSKRYPNFLRYIVKEALDGNIDQIKERTIGIEVFGRPPDYDTNSDTAVRYTAGEVRKRLALYNSHAKNNPILITLSARSYHPEFYRIVEDNSDRVVSSEAVSDAAEHPAQVAPESSDLRVSRKRWQKAAIWLASLLVAIVLGWAGQLVWMKHVSQASDQFWSPVTQAKGQVLISPGSDLPAAICQSQIATPGTPSELPYLSLENSLAMGRIAALLSSGKVEYTIQPSATLTFSQINESFAVLIGAYNNIWTRCLLLPLRFHFNEGPEKAIIDSWHPGKRWMRDRSKPYQETPDYGIVARFRNPSTDSIVVVVAGLDRYGTDAASQFAVSSHFLSLLNEKIGSDWKNKNLEVVIQVDVENGRAGVPIIVETQVW